MKMSILAALLACFAPIVAHAAHTAEPAPRQHHRRMAAPEHIALRLLVRNLLMQQYDADQNGQLSPEECERIHKEAKEAMRKQAAEFAAHFDHDKDGRLTPEEHQEMRQALLAKRGKSGKRPPRLHRHKAAQNADAQADNPPTPPRKHRRHKRMGKKARMLAYTSHRLLLQAYDADDSGQLDEPEMTIYRQHAAKLYEQRKAELLQRFDTDANGSISETEFESARAELSSTLPRCHPYIPTNFEDIAILTHLCPSACKRCSK